jgi:hypothetical protein
MKTSLLRFAMALIFAMPFVAQAAVVSAFGPSGGAFGDSSITGGAFNDSFEFTVTGNDSAVVVITAPLIGNFTITDPTFALTTLGGTPISGTQSVQFLTFPGIPGFQQLVFSDTFASLAPGPHFLDFSGSFGAAGGSYAGTLALVGAVPEPSTWAAMIVGLGMMIYVARRRRVQGP